MLTKKTIFVIIGSASQNSSNQQLMNFFAKLTEYDFNVKIYTDLKLLPHFDPELSINNPPVIIETFRNAIQKADGIVICTPEYVFSLPSGLKNAMEWCVSTNIFSDKPTGLITASADGQKGHEALQLLMKTVMADFTNETALLIQGIKGKLNEHGELKDDKTKQDIINFTNAFKAIIKNKERY